MDPAESAILGSIGFGTQDFHAVRGLLARFGDGLRSTARALHLDVLADSMDPSLQHALGVVQPLTLPAADAAGAPHDPTKSLPRIAGAAFLAGRYRDSTSPRNARRAFVLKVAYIYLQDSLDHLLDHGTYDHAGALRLYYDALGPMTAPDADLRTLGATLRRDLNPDQADAAGPLALLVRVLRDGINEAPNGDRPRPHIRWVNERFTWAQAASVFQRRARLDIRAIRRIASTFWAPEPDLLWHERFAAHLSWVTNCSLIDLCFADERPSPGELRDHMCAWYYFDAVISYLDHLADVRADYREGIVNDALLSMGESHPGWNWATLGSVPGTTAKDLERFLGRVAEFEGRALSYARRSRQGGDVCDPLLALMIPVVMLSRCEPDDGWMLPALLRQLEPALRECTGSRYHSATYSQQASPLRTQRGFVTRPLNPRDFRMPS